MEQLRSALIKLAHNNPSLRPHLLPLLKEGREAGMFDDEPTQDKAKEYRVQYTVTVDYPELRGPSYPVVPAGTKLPQTDKVRSWRNAQRRYKELLSGEDDYESEYISMVQATAIYPFGQGPTHRTIGPLVYRKRDDRGRITEQVSRGRRATTNREEWPAIFDSLKAGQKVYLAMKGGGFGDVTTDGEYHEWKVYRRFRGRDYETITLFKQDGSKPQKQNATKLWKQDWKGNPSISASKGDMSLRLHGMKT